MDVVTRLRSTRATMLGTEDEQHFADCHEAADEIERLYLEHREMRSLLLRIGRNPENVSHDSLLRDDLHAWLKTHNAELTGRASAACEGPR